MGTDDRDRATLTGRRAFIKWSVAAGAALGLPRWKVFEILGKQGGVALADEAACHPTNRSVHIVAPNGGFAWFHLMWPHNDVATGAADTAALHTPGETTRTPGTDRPLTVTPDTPWRSLPPDRQVTALLGGTLPIGTVHYPDRSLTGLIDPANGISLYAAAAGLQSTNPTVVPAIAIGGLLYGDADDAPAAVTAADAAGMVGIFDSHAAAAGGALADPDDAALYAAGYGALQAMESAAGRPAAERVRGVGRGAASRLGTNLGPVLRTTKDDLARYGVDDIDPAIEKTVVAGGGIGLGDLVAFADVLCTTARALALGLTSCVLVPAMADDPHGAFAYPAATAEKVRRLGRILDVFLADLAATADPGCVGATLADHTVISIHGDTPKDPLSTAGWIDTTPDASNWLYVLGTGWLKTGWFGGIDARGRVTGWNPQTGQPDPGRTSAQTAAEAAAAVAYAVARGDLDRVRAFNRALDLGGIIRPRQR
jgi:hypothetical protein